MDHHRKYGPVRNLYGPINTFSYYLEINNNFARRLISLRANTLKGNIILTGGFEDDGSDEGQISDKVCRKEKK